MKKVQTGLVTQTSQLTAQSADGTGKDTASGVPRAFRGGIKFTASVLSTEPRPDKGSLPRAYQRIADGGNKAGHGKQKATANSGPKPPNRPPPRALREAARMQGQKSGGELGGALGKRRQQLRPQENGEKEKMRVQMKRQLEQTRKRKQRQEEDSAGASRKQRSSAPGLRALGSSAKAPPPPPPAPPAPPRPAPPTPPPVPRQAERAREVPPASSAMVVPESGQKLNLQELLERAADEIRRNQAIPKRLSAAAAVQSSVPKSAQKAPPGALPPPPHARSTAQARLSSKEQERALAAAEPKQVPATPSAGVRHQKHVESQELKHAEPKLGMDQHRAGRRHSGDFVRTKEEIFEATSAGPRQVMRRVTTTTVHERQVEWEENAGGSSAAGSERDSLALPERQDQLGQVALASFSSPPVPPLPPPVRIHEQPDEIADEVLLLDVLPQGAPNLEAMRSSLLSWPGIRHLRFWQKPGSITYRAEVVGSAEALSQAHSEIEKALGVNLVVLAGYEAGPSSMAAVPGEDAEERCCIAVRGLQDAIGEGGSCAALMSCGRVLQWLRGSSGGLSHCWVASPEAAWLARRLLHGRAASPGGGSSLLVLDENARAAVARWREGLRRILARRGAGDSMSLPEDKELDSQLLSLPSVAAAKAQLAQLFWALAADEDSGADEAALPAASETNWDPYLQ